MTKNPLVVNENMPASKALAIMNEKKLQVCLLFQIKIFIKKIKN